MSESTLDTDDSRDYARIVLIASCLLATVLAGILVPAVTGGNVASSPAGSLFPGEAVNGSAPGDPTVGQGQLTGEPSSAVGTGGGTGSSGFGALNPGTSTDVGGTRSIDGNNAFQSQSTTVHLTVESSQPAYWRTASYDRYTGSGWVQTSNSQPYTGTIDGGGIDGPRMEYQVTLNRTATAIPTVWQPDRVTGLGGLQVTDGLAVQSTGALAPGTTYTAVSHRPPRDPTVLQSAGQTYPDAIESRYTGEEPSGDSRVKKLTDTITADADNSYEKAQAIETWLETRKEYSLNVSRTSSDMAETFIFDMEKGYCEYFATSMVVMLRSQDIPARYVVGYSTGQQVGENTYRVRALNAHAWVEVYFEDVGWVKFDPTPGRSRLQQEQQSVQRQQPETNYAPQEQGSPGEEFSPGGNGTDRPTPTDPGEGNDSADTLGETNGYDVSLNRSAVPGADVTVTVTQDGSPVEGRVVQFNGEQVGTTDGNGTVVARVPYTDELRIEVGTSTEAALASLGGATSRDRYYSVGQIDRQEQVTVPVETNASVSVSGEQLPGATVTVTAIVGDVPVRGGTVLVDGEPTASTDSDGRAQIQLPERSGTVTIAVQRDPIAGETTVSLPDVTVSMEPTAPLALPLTDATVAVRAEGEPVGGATVSRNGQQVATTDFNGTATVELPLAASATVTVSARGLTREATVSGLLVNLLLVLATLGGLIGAVLYAGRRSGYSLREVPILLGRLPAHVVKYGQWALVTLARMGEELFAQAIARLQKTIAYLREFVRGQQSLADLRAQLRAWVGVQRARLRALLRRRGVGTSNGADEPGERLTDEDRISIREAWARFLDAVTVRRRYTKTPGEIARHAIESDGLPAEPVRVLRDSFRAVEYGSRSAGERLERVKAAITEIERSEDDTRSDGGRPHDSETQSSADETESRGGE
ncbi:MAG: transglutaminase-like putative cysteine protease [Haloarculaceae archaeon]|jgi:transglutaminase-like putative cysteine protease